MGNLGMHVLVGYYVAYDIKAGADLGTRLASPGPKANLVSPTTVGECASHEPALAPSRNAVPGFDDSEKSTNDMTS